MLKSRRRQLGLDTPLRFSLLSHCLRVAWQYGVGSRSQWLVENIACPVLDVDSRSWEAMTDYILTCRFAGGIAIGDGPVQFVARGPKTEILCRRTSTPMGHGNGECQTYEGLSGPLAGKLLPQPSCHRTPDAGSGRDHPPGHGTLALSRTRWRAPDCPDRLLSVQVPSAVAPVRSGRSNPGRPTIRWLGEGQGNAVHCV
jgi:hypothetical protein